MQNNETWKGGGDCTFIGTKCQTQEAFETLLLYMIKWNILFIVGHNKKMQLDSLL